MATFHFHAATTATPEQFIAALTDFGPGRAQVFPNSADDYLRVHHLGANEADVTEGSSGTWERSAAFAGCLSRVVLQVGLVPQSVHVLLFQTSAFSDTQLWHEF